MKKLSVSFLLIFVLCFNCVSVFASNGESESVKKIQQLVTIAEHEKEIYGESTKTTLCQLEQELERIGVATGSYSGTHFISTVSTRGYGETHDLGW